MITFFENIAKKEGIHIEHSKTLSGGDTNKVVLLNCKEGDFVLKLQLHGRATDPFDCEAKGLDLLRETETFTIPLVKNIGNESGYDYLLMNYLKMGERASKYWRDFAEKLSLLHRNSTSHFGLDHDNYIGKLPQHNTPCDNATTFYITQRIEPQFKLSKKLGYPIPNLKNFYKNIAQEIPNEAPSLIHGDLWNGNHLTDEKGNPALIDPAVSYAPREMDLAMMRLFGGFPSEVFQDYNAFFPLIENWEERIPLWQLYYLWVHLNIFGKGYLESVLRILKQYS